MAEPLAKGVIEIGIDDMRLQQEVASGQSTLAKGFRETLNRARLTQSEMQKIYKINNDLRSVDMTRVKLAEAQQRTTQRLAATSQFHLNVIKKLTSEWQVITRFAKQEDAPKRSMLDRVGSAWGKGKTIAGAAMAGGTAVSGLAFAGAAMAGSTTLETLTGSLKNLGLVVGGKVQPQILALSKWIQGLSSSARNLTGMDISAAALGVTGASIGYRYGGIRGAAVGGALGLGAGFAAGGSPTLGYGMMGASAGMALGGVPGMIVGGTGGMLLGEIQKLREQKQWNIDTLANKIARDPDKAGRALGRAAMFEKKDPAVAQLLRDAVKKSEQMRLADPDAFKAAGLNMPASYAGLADVRQQAQMSVFSMGPLEMKNWMEEMKNNLAVVAAAAQPNGNVAPPQ